MRDIEGSEPDDVSEVPGDLRVDVEDVGVHEFGHFGGLADIYDPGYPGYVWQMGAGNEDVSMNGLIKYTEVRKRSLEQGELDGITYIYSHIPASKLDLVLVIDASETFESNYMAIDEAKSSAVALVHQLRDGDRIGVLALSGADGDAFDDTEFMDYSVVVATRSPTSPAQSRTTTRA